MGRVIGSVVLGYIAMFATVFILFTVAWVALGAEGAFLPATFQTTALWIALSVVISLAAAVDGGYVAAVVAKSDARALWGLVGLVVVLGVIYALPVLNQADAPAAARGATVTMAEAMPAGAAAGVDRAGQPGDRRRGRLDRLPTAARAGRGAGKRRLTVSPTAWRRRRRGPRRCSRR